MALGDSRNILVGAASIFLSNQASGSADVTGKPAFVSGQSYRTTLDSGTWSPSETDPANVAAWKNVGYTMEGLELSYEPDYGDVEVDQVLDSVLTFKQSMRVSLNTTLAEATLYNLMLAWGQSGATLTSNASEAELDISAGELGGAPVERSLIAVGNGNYARNTSVYSERTYHAYRVLNVEATTIGSKRNEATGIPVSLRALPANNGLYGKMKERRRTW